MKDRAFAQRTIRKTTDAPSQHSSVGDNAIALDPPDYGIEFVDRGLAAGIRSGLVPSTAAPESKIEEKLRSADNRILWWRRRADLQDALILLRTLDAARLRALVARLDVGGRLLDVLARVDENDQREFSDVLARISILRNTLLEFAKVTDPTQKKFPIASSPPDTIWRTAREFESVEEVEREAGTFERRTGMKLGSLGILAHGDAAGVIQMGSDIVRADTFNSFRKSFTALAQHLAPDADVYIYGCISGSGAFGTALLKKISLAMPGRRIIGFNVINFLDSNATLVKSESRFSPRLLTSEVQSTIEVDKRSHRDPSEFYQTLKPATADSAHAKVTKDGVVLKWPALADEIRSQRPRDSGYETPEIDGVDVEKPREPPPSSPPVRRRRR